MRIPAEQKKAIRPDRQRQSAEGVHLGWRDPAWLLVLVLSVVVPLAYDPLALQLKRVIAHLLITAGLVFLLLRRGRAPRRQLVLPALALPVCIVLAAGTISLGVAANRYDGVLALYQHGLLSLGLLTLMANAIHSRDQIVGLVGCLCGAAALAAVVGIVQLANPAAFAAWGAGGEAIGTTGQTNYLGAYLAVAGLLAAGLALGGSSWVSRGLGLTCLAIITLGLLATRVRAAWLGYAGGLGTVTLLALATRRRQPPHRSEPPGKVSRAKVLVWTLLAAGVIGAGLAVWHGEFLPGRSRSIFNPTTIMARIQYWRDALDMVRDHWLLGVGVGNSSQAFLAYNRAPESTPMLILYLGHLHNEPLAVLAELGLLGVAATVPFLVVLARLARRAVLGEKGTGDFLGVAAVGGLVAAGIDSLFFFNLHEVTSAMSIWLVVGIVEATARGTATPPPALAGPGPPGGGTWWRKSLGRLKPWVAVLASLTLVVAFWLWAVRPGMAAYLARRGMVALRTGHPLHAISLLHRAREWDPRHSPAYELLGQALQAEGRHDEAILAFQESLRLNPKDIVALDSLGLLYRMTGRAAEARAMYQRSLAINPFVGTTHKVLGDLLLAEGKAGEASVHFHRAVELVPRYAAAANALARAYLQSGRLDEAETVFKQAVTSDPGFAEAWLILFMLRGSRGEWPEAARTLAQLLRLHPSLEAEARRSQFFPQVWAAGVSMGILPVGGAKGSARDK